MSARVVPFLAVLLPWTPSAAVEGDGCKTVFGSVTPCEIRAFADTGSVANAQFSIFLNNTSSFNWLGQVYPSDTEACAAIANDDWILFSPLFFVAPQMVQSTRLITVTLNATQLADGLHEATACVRVEMDDVAVFAIPVRLVVGDEIFVDGFE